MLYHELHQIQSNPANQGYLPKAALHSLSERTGTPLCRLQELASYYPHFRLSPPAQVEVRVCRDMSCHLRGAGTITEKLKTTFGKLTSKQISIDGVSCLGRCDRGPVACVNGQYHCGQSSAELTQIVQSAIDGPARPSQGDTLSSNAQMKWNIDPYGGEATYKAFRQFLEQPFPNWLIKELEKANLLGMGGAGAPAFRKWNDVAQAPAADGQKYVVCNGDESEPGTFKDREILLRSPYLVVEGMMLAGLTIGASRGFVFIRHEYPQQIAAVRRAIQEASIKGLLGSRILGTDFSFFLEVVESPGGYILGEQGALIEALEEKRGQPRNRPPQLETNGLFDKPTLLSNVETFAWAVPIALYGGEWYAERGTNGSQGMRFFSISGDVNQPGVFEVPIGLTLGELLQMAGGTCDGQPPLAIAPSGPSGGFIPLEISIRPDRLPPALVSRVAPGQTRISVLDLPLDLALFRTLGMMLGAGIVVYGQGRDMLEQAANCTRFFRNESCGKCVPCRLGSEKLAQIAESLTRSAQQLDEANGLVRQLATAMEMTSICGLGVSAPNPLISWFKYFHDGAERRTTFPAAKGERKT